MITPKYLKSGDKVALIAPAGKTEKQIVENAISVLSAEGLNPVMSDYVFDNHFQFASTDRKRLDDMQKMLDDDAIKAIFCIRGGYGMVRIIDHIDFDQFIKNPKWITGFSDITVLLNHIQENFRIETIHGMMAAGISGEGDPFKYLMDALSGKTLSYSFPNHPLSRRGSSKGELTGGNLAILTSLIGSVSEVNTENKILFIEEVGENLYRIERMMYTLKRSGKLSELNGLIVGGMTSIPDKKSDFGMDPYEIVENIVKEYDYPVVFGFPAGHQNNNFPLINGRNITLNVDDHSAVIFESK